MKPFQNGKILSKRQPLKFPIAVQSDTDDIFDGREIIEARFKEEWLTPQLGSKDLDKVPKIVDNLYNKSKLNIDLNNNTSLSNPISKLNTTLNENIIR